MHENKFSANWHTHTHLCKHASGEAADYAREALEAGIDILGFSEHMPTPDDRWLSVRPALAQMPEYRRSVEVARETYPQLRIYYGVECEYMPEWRNFYLDELLGNQGCEYLIFGAHNFVYAGEIVSAYSAKLAVKGTGLLRAYVDNVVAGIESGLFRMVAHPDLFGAAYDDWCADMEAASRDIARAAAAAAIPLEINSYGIRKRLKDTSAGQRWLYPWEPFWHVAAEEGAHAIINSDAHSPLDIAAAIEPARELARKCGIRLIMPRDLEPENWK